MSDLILVDDFLTPEMSRESLFYGDINRAGKTFFNEAAGVVYYFLTDAADSQTPAYSPSSDDVFLAKSSEYSYAMDGVKYICLAYLGLNLPGLSLIPYRPVIHDHNGKDMVVMKYDNTISSTNGWYGTTRDCLIEPIVNGNVYYFDNTGIAMLVEYGNDPTKAITPAEAAFQRAMRGVG